MALVDLEKKVGVVLEKRRLPKPPVTRVGLSVDASGSMESLYATDVVQRAVDRVLGVASKFDDDGNLDMWVFDDGFERLPQATPSLYGGYVDRHILDHMSISGGTAYAPFMKDVARFYFGPPDGGGGLGGLVKRSVGALFGRRTGPEAPAPASRVPALVLPITDGDNAADDKPAVVAFLEETQDLPIYWQFCGIGPQRFAFLRKIADKYPNVGFCAVPDLGRASDEAFYETLLSQEMVDWVRRFGA